MIQVDDEIFKIMNHSIPNLIMIINKLLVFEDKVYAKFEKLNNWQAYMHNRGKSGRQLYNVNY